MSYPVGWRPYLFVGGPWNGQVHLIKDGHYEWHVRQPLPGLGAPHPFSSEERDPFENVTPRSRTWTYVRRLYRMRYGLEWRVAWVFLAQNDETDVVAAAFTALGIPMERQGDDLIHAEEWVA